MKWEYLCKWIPSSECAFNEVLNKLGLDGWELATALEGNQGAQFLFKRPIQEQIERPILKLKSIATTHVSGVGLVKTIANPGPSPRDSLWINVQRCVDSEVEIDGERYVVSRLTFSGDIARSPEWGLCVRPIATKSED